MTSVADRLPRTESVSRASCWILQSGAAWRFLPDAYPSPSTCWRRLQRWQERDVWLDAWRALLGTVDDADEASLLRWDKAFLHGSFAPAKKGPRGTTIRRRTKSPSRPAAMDYRSHQRVVGTVPPFAGASRTSTLHLLRLVPLDHSGVSLNWLYPSTKMLCAAQISFNFFGHTVTVMTCPQKSARKAPRNKVDHRLVSRGIVQHKKRHGISRSHGSPSLLQARSPRPVVSTDEQDAEWTRSTGKSLALLPR